ncbi:MAG: dynamin family protein [Pseudomonadota bacterium]
METQHNRIGHAHRDTTDRLAAMFATLSGLCPPQLSEQVASGEAALLNWRARIAVIGQVKAGKSTFLGALVGHPGMLPSEVNPWTAVVTNLHFAHPDDPQAGGVFHFYDESSWSRIIEGDPEMHALAEQLMPGFATDVLREQVEMMRERARTRLGQFYHLLLGKQHSYDAVQRHTLERYVCAGFDRDPNADIPGPAGRYADLTERADIYLPPEPFACPAVLSDTPGVNDPFMVRDANTCRSLSQAEIFIVTLSAHQALTEVDLALLRMLSMRPENRVIVFINRIDELSDPLSDSRAVLDNVRARLDETLPGHGFALIAGSARWAELVMGGDAAGDTDGEALATELAEPRFRALLDAMSGPDDAARLLAASGIPEVRKTLSGIIDQGTGPILCRRTAQDLLGLIDGSISALDAPPASDPGDAATPNATDPAEPTDMAEDPSGQLDRTRTEWSDMLNRNRDDLAALGTDAVASMRRELEQTLRDHVDRQCAELQEVIARGDAADSFSFDTLALRTALEDSFTANYRGARDRLDARIATLRGAAERVAQPILGTAVPQAGLSDLPGQEVTPVFLTSSNHLTLALTSQRSWKFWQRNTMQPGENLNRLARLIRAEFFATIDNFMRDGEEALADRTEAGHQDIQRLYDVVLARLEGGDAAGDADLSVGDRLDALRQLRDRVRALSAGLPEATPVAAAPQSGWMPDPALPSVAQTAVQ